jgi:solute carrier family 29 (equilibrative nucleoside transporter), member 1/2/3
VLCNAIAQASLGAYLQTSVIAIGSLFGPSAVQIIMAGQAAVAVAVSGVQVISAVASTWDARPITNAAIEQRGPEERSAFIFFSLSTLFFLVTAVTQHHLSSVPTYKMVVHPFTISQDEGRGKLPFEKARILSVAKANILYEVAGAYVFVITLV